MNLQTLQSVVAERVRAIPLLAGLPVFEEEKGNVVRAVEEEIARSCFCVVVGGVSFADEAPDSRLCHGTTHVTVSVFEDPLLNRDVNGRPTYLMAAQEVARTLKLFDTGEGVLTSPTVSPPADLGGGVISCTVTLTAKTTL